MPDAEERRVIEAPPPRRKRGGGAKALFVLLVILALAGVIVYLLSLINSKRFFLVPEGGELVVKKGIFFPVGNELYRPTDPEQARLYQPIELPEQLRHAAALQFEDLPSLNRELAKYLIEHAERMVFSDDDKFYQRGRAYLERVSHLHGLDPQQIEKVKSLQADVDYLEAKRSYQGVEKILERALRKFRKAQAFGSGRFQDADVWIAKIGNLLDAIKRAKASAPASAPATGPAPETPPAAPAPQQPAPPSQQPAPAPAAPPAQGI
ncbi:MAG: hypothetical protein DRI34_10675 [Deltaproteobacteria bacterium]|nr:MAG: hypothetical protein DRI34_10675 [Deltaproteobacteria bacterium]